MNDRENEIANSRYTYGNTFHSSAGWKATLKASSHHSLAI